MRKIIVFSLLLVFIASCKPPQHAHKASVDPGTWIPKNFNPKNGILLVEYYPYKTDKYNKLLHDWLNQNYPGKYELVEKRFVLNKDGKYADTALYPFGIIWSLNTEMDYKSSYTSSHLEMYSHFFDRSLGRDYPNSSKYPGNATSEYIPFFNAILSYFNYPPASK